MPPPIVHPGNGQWPVVLSVAHAGRDYPEWLIEQARGGRPALESLEDPHVDRIVEAAMGHGVGAVIATAPRAAIDCNRSEDDIDPAVIRDSAGVRPTARARAGLGIVPGRTASQGALWRRPITRSELERRLDQAHRPFHQAIESQLSALVDRFGGALLLDCHSMPPPPGAGPPVIFGDRHGRTAAGWLLAEALRIARAAGYAAGVNDPFAGGHTIARHGAPGFGVHAIQIEIDRRCYLCADGRTLAPQSARASALIERLAVGLGTMLRDRAMPAAAE